jgi:DNA-binding transcriptional regulator PaaX
LLRWAAAEREAWLEAVTHDPLLPGRILPSDYLGQQAMVAVRKDRRRVEVLRDASRQLRTFKTRIARCKPLLHMRQKLVMGVGGSG